MTDSSHSLASNSLSEFHVLTEVDPSDRYGRSKLTEESIAKLRSKIENQKRKVSDSLTSSFISSQEETPPYYSSSRKVAKLQPSFLPVPGTVPAETSAQVEVPSRKIAPSNPSLTEETRPKRIIGKTDPTLPVSNLKTKPAAWMPRALEKPKQKCATAASSVDKAVYITPYSWRRGHAIVSQLQRSKSLSEGSLSSSTSASVSRDQIQTGALVSDEYAYDSRLRAIFQDSCLDSLERDSLDFETEFDVNAGLEPLPVVPYPPIQEARPFSLFLSSEHIAPSLSQSAPNLKKSEGPGTVKGPFSKRTKIHPTTAPPDEAPTTPRIRHYERKNIQEYMRRQKENRKDKALMKLEEKTRVRDVKNQRLQDLYLKQKCMLTNNLMLSKVRQLNIPTSYLSQISSETYVRNTPVDFTQIQEIEDSTSEVLHSFRTAHIIEEVSDPIHTSQVPTNTESPPFTGVVLRSMSPPALSPVLSTRVENIRIAALALREKLDEGYQKAEREIATLLPGIPSREDLSLHSSAHMSAVWRDSPLVSPAFLSVETVNEDLNSRRETYCTDYSLAIPDSLAPVFLTKKDSGDCSVSRQKCTEVRSLSQTDWQARSDGDPMSAINIYARRHTHTPGTKPRASVRTEGVQTSSPEKEHQGVDTFSLHSDVTSSGKTYPVESRSKIDSSSAAKRQARYKHRKPRQQRYTEDSVTEGEVLESQMKRELRLSETLEEADRQLIKVERLTSHFPSEYQNRIVRQKSYFEEQIKLLATRMEIEPSDSREFHQLSPLTEITEPEFGEKADAEDIEGERLAPKDREVEEAREKNRSSADLLTQDINRTREEATKALIEISKHRIEADQRVITSTPSSVSHTLPPPSQLETAASGLTLITYSEDFNSEELSNHSESGTPDTNTPHPTLESDDERKVELDTSKLVTPAVEQVLPPGPVVGEDSMISISDVSAAYASESELIQYEDRIFQMLLPSKSHRRHSNRSSPSKHSRHDTSTDSESFLVSPPITHSKSKEEESFQTFLDHMVTSFLKKDLERKKHQAMLLELRENAIEGRTNMQLKWVQMMGKKSEHKARDLKMPHLQKLKRDILTRHERECEEVKKLKETLSSNRETAFIKKQQRFIKELRHSTQHVKHKIDRMTSGHSFILDDVSPNHSSFDASSIQEQHLSATSISRSQTKPHSLSRLQTPRSLVDLTSDDPIDRVKSPVLRAKSLESELQGLSVSERIFLKTYHSREKKSFSPESSEGNTLSIFTDIGDSPSRSSLNSKTDSNVDEHSLPCSPKQVSVTETYSEHTDVEQRVAWLKRKLSQRMQTAKQLDIELKRRKQRQELLARELALKQQLKEFNKKILETQQQLGHSYSRDSATSTEPEGSVPVLSARIETPRQQTPVPALSHTETVTEQLTHSEEQTPTGTDVGVETLEQEVLPLTSQGNKSTNTIQYSDTFLTSIDEGGSPTDGAQEAVSPQDQTVPLEILRQERDKISDNLLLSEMALSELDEKRFEAGDEVLIRDNLRGTVRYAGTTGFVDGIWIGIELREPVGTSNGTIKDVSYFDCAPNHGVFIQPANLCKLADSTEYDIELSPADSDLESIPGETSWHSQASFEPLVSVVSDAGPDRSITVLSETESVGTAADDQTIRWSLEIVDQEMDACVSEGLRQGIHSNEALVTSVTDKLINEWARESVDIFLSVNSRRAPFLLHNVRPALLQLSEEATTPDELSPLSAAQPPAISLELLPQSLLKIADSALTFYNDRIHKQRPLDIGQLQFSRRSDTILPIAYNAADSPNRQAHHQIFRHFLFDLSYQVISELRTETAPAPLTLQPPKKKHRSFESRKLAYKSPRPGEEAAFVANQVSDLIDVPTQTNHFQGYKEDPVEILLLKEMREEEPEWIDYSQHEYQVKLEASDAIFRSMLEESLNIAMTIRRKKQAKRALLLT